MIPFFFAVIFGFAVYLLVTSVSIANQIDSANAIRRVERLTGSTLQEDLTGAHFWTVARKKGLAAAIQQADLDVTPAGFLRTGVLIAVIVAGAVFVFTQNLIAGVFIGAASIAMYVNWLHQRRDKKRLEYDQALADMCDRLAAGAQVTNTLMGSIQHANLSAPPIVLSDFQFVESVLSQGGSLKDAFEPIQNRRASSSLDLMVDALLTWSTKGSAVSLSNVLTPLSSTIRQMAAQRAKVEAELSGVRYRLVFASLAPLAFVALLRSSMPAFADAYASPMGSVLLIVAALISSFGYWLGEKQLSAVRRTLDVN